MDCAGNVRHAEEVFEMKRQSIAPDSETYRTLIEGYVKIGDVCTCAERLTIEAEANNIILIEQGHSCLGVGWIEVSIWYWS